MYKKQNLPKYKDGNEENVGLGNIPGVGVIRDRLYQNIMPMGYDNPVQRFINAVVLNKREGERDFKQPSDAYKILDNIWGEYLLIPKDKRKYNNRKYGVSLYTEDGKNYIQLNNPKILFSDIKKAALGGVNKTVKSNGDWYYTENAPAVGFNTNRNVLSNFILGDFLVQRKLDPSGGEYVEYTDTWDINPYQNTDNIYGQLLYEELPWYDKIASNVINKYISKNPNRDASFGIGKPLNVKGRIYLDDLYGIPKNLRAPKKGDYYGGWLPEVTIKKYKSHTRNEPRNK